MSGSEERTLAPSARKLRKAREKGQIPLQRDTRVLVVTTAGLGFVWLAFDRFRDLFRTGMELAIAGIVAPEEGFDRVVGYALGEAARTVGMLVVVLLVALVLSSIVLNRGLVLSFDPITPKLSNMDPVKGLGNIFGARSLIELAKSLARLGFAAGGVALVVMAAAGSLVRAPFCGSGCLLGLTLTLAALVFAVVIGVALVAAVVDLPIQAWLFTRNQKMSHSEMKAERKDTQGSPEIRRAQRRLRTEEQRAVGRGGVGRATIIVFGEAHAVALRYVKAEHNTPIVVARARGARTAEFLEQARLLMVPFYRDEDLAARLVANGQTGHPIHKSEFPDTAKAITTVSRRAA